MAHKRSRGKSTVDRRGPSRPLRRVCVGVIILVAAAPSVHRALWRWNERSEVGVAAEAVRTHGCYTCHPGSITDLRWRGDGERPQTSAVIRDALERGRPAVPGMPGPMPAYAERVGKGTLDRLVLGVEISAGMIGVSDESEIRIGLTIAAEMGCFDCHGPIGAGGVPNPGTVAGLVPGFFGVSFARQAQSPAGIAGVVRDGRSARRAWWTPWTRPALDMPAYANRLDSTEIALLVHAIRSLPADPSAE